MKDEIALEEELSEEESEAQAEAGFKSGFDKVRGDLAPTPDGAEEEEADEEEDPGEAKAEEKESADRKAFMDKLPERLRAIEGNVGGMMTKVDQAIKQVTAKAATSKTTPSEDQVKSALDNPEAYADLVEDYPGFKPVLDEFRSLRETIDELRTKKEEEPKDTSEEDARRLTEKHSDWRELSQTKEWVNWSLEDGPSAEEHANVVKMFQTDRLSEAKAILDGWQQDLPGWWKEKGSLLFGDTEAAIHLLDNYKTFQKQRKTNADSRNKKQDRLSRTVTPDGVGGGSAITVTDQKAFANGFNKVMKNSLVGNHRR